MDIKSPFSDRIEKSPVPTRGTNGGQYDTAEGPDLPSRTGGDIPELHRDAFTGTPGGSMYKTPFKDRIEK